jgi:hypothetical protein
MLILLRLENSFSLHTVSTKTIFLNVRSRYYTRTCTKTLLGLAIRVSQRIRNMQDES